MFGPIRDELRDGVSSLRGVDVLKAEDVVFGEGRREEFAFGLERARKRMAKRGGVPGQIAELALVGQGG